MELTPSKIKSLNEMFSDENELASVTAFLEKKKGRDSIFGENDKIKISKEKLLEKVNGGTAKVVKVKKQLAKMNASELEELIAIAEELKLTLSEREAAIKEAEKKLKEAKAELERLKGK